MIDQRVRLLTLRCIGYLFGRQRTMKFVHTWKKSSLKSPVIRLLVVAGLIVSIVTFSSQFFLFDNQETTISDDNSNLIAITTQLAANSLTADQNGSKSLPSKSDKEYPGVQSTSRTNGRHIRSRKTILHTQSLPGGSMQIVRQSFCYD